MVQKQKKFILKEKEVSSQRQDDEQNEESTKKIAQPISGDSFKKFLESVLPNFTKGIEIFNYSFTPELQKILGEQIQLKDMNRLQELSIVKCDLSKTRQLDNRGLF